MKIRVHEKATGKVVEIRSEDFDAEAHERLVRVKVKATGEEAEIRESQVTEADHERLETDAAEVLAQAILERVDDRIQQHVGRMAGRVDRTRLANHPDAGELPEIPAEGPIRYGRSARDEIRTGVIKAIGPAWERAARNHYASLPEWERRQRSVEADVELWRYLRATVQGDRATILEVLARDPIYSHLSREELVRQLGTGSGSAGSMVPTPIADLVVQKRDRRERIAPIAQRLVSEATSLTVPTEGTVGGVSGVGENAPIPETDSTFPGVTLTKKKAGRLVKSSRELLLDMSGAFSLATILSDQAARKLAVYMDGQSAQDGDGVGTNHTDALAQNTSIGEIAATSGAFARSKILDLIYGLPEEYRQGAVMMGNDGAARVLAGAEDGTGRPLYLPQGTVPPGVVGDSSDAAAMNVEGYPFVNVPFTENILMFGLLSEGFAVLLDGGIRVESTTEGAGAFENDQVAWKMVERRDSAVVNADAFKKTDGAIT